MEGAKFSGLKLGDLSPTKNLRPSPHEWMNSDLLSSNILVAGPSSSSAPTCRAEHPQPTQEGLSTWMGLGVLFTSTSHLQIAAEST